MRHHACTTALLLLLAAACGDDEPVKDLDARVAIEGALPDPDTPGGLLVDFGTVVTGASAEVELVLHNRSGSASRLEPLQLPPPFASSAAAGLVLPPWGRASLALSFQPTAAATAEASAFLRTPSGATPLRLVGAGIAERVRCLPGVLDFGETLAQAPKVLTVRCENGSAGEVAIGVDRLEGDGAFALEELEPGAAIRLTPGASGEIAVRFAPRESGRAEATLVLATDGRWKLPAVQLRGLGLDGSLHVLPRPPDCLEFFPTPVGTSTSAAILFENVTGELRFASEVELPEGFTIERPLPLRLEPDEPDDRGWTGSTWLPITFTPRRLGPVEGVVRIRTDDPEVSSAEVCVRAFGGGPSLACDESIDLGTVPVGEEIFATVRCENRGAPAGAAEAVLDLYEVSATSVDLHAALADPMARHVAPGDTFTVRVRARTDRPGEIYGAVVVVSNDRAAPAYAIPVRGFAE